MPYFHGETTGLVGVKVALGETHTTKVIPAPKPVEKIIERIMY